MDYTGTFDGLAVDFATNKQKASLTLNEDARQAFENLRGKQIAITIKAYKKKRSLDANSYFHVLVGKIADVTGNSKVYIKNKLIAEYGQYETINGALVPLPLDDDIDAYNVEFVHLQPTSKTTTNQKGKVFRVNSVCDRIHFHEYIQECIKAVEEQPTVFDVEKVLDKLKHEESEALRRYSESKGTAYAFSDKCSCDNWAKAIGIVKRGGRDEK